jgi:hypothetical protein
MAAQGETGQSSPRCRYSRYLVLFATSNDCFGGEQRQTLTSPGEFLRRGGIACSKTKRCREPLLRYFRGIMLRERRTVKKKAIRKLGRGLGTICGR